jgi:hypothetical protein
MLSKAEILYLQGQKHISRSYERKLKCLIRKKLEVLQRELPLLSKILKNEVRSFADISATTDIAAPVAKDKRGFNQPNQPLTPNNRATEFSNAESNGIEIDAGKDIKSQNSEGFTHLLMDNSTHATEFSNEKCDVKGVCESIGAREGLESSKNSSNDHHESEATKNSNSDEKRRRERDLNSVAILEETK